MDAVVQSLVDFREVLHGSFPFRADATMDLIDAIGSNDSAQSAVELSQNPFFRRQYGSLHDAVDNFFVPDNAVKAKEERFAQQQVRMHIAAEHCPEPARRNFYLLGLDVTGQPRPYAKTLEDRGFNYHPNPAPGNKPISVGHAYSVLAALPEKTSKVSPPWVIPFLIQRVPTDEKAVDVGAAQVTALLNAKDLPFGSELSALVGDSAYSACQFVQQMAKHNNLALIVRSRGNRVFYRTPEQSVSSSFRGHPTWYGIPFRMKDPSTWGTHDAMVVVPFTFRNGRVCQVQIEAWYNLLMRGQRDIPMHDQPFTLIRITVTDSTTGKVIFRNPLWLMVSGKRRHEISLSDVYEAYRQRYDLEHFFRFGKNKLLMNSYQTPDVEHEENWWDIAGLAYLQLYVAAKSARNHPKPWERYLPELKEPETGELVTPSMVMRSLAGIIQVIGTPSTFPKPRGKSPGRQKGCSIAKRPCPPVVKKGKKGEQKHAQGP